MKDFYLRLGGLNLPCHARYDETIEYFRAFGQVLPAADPAQTGPKNGGELPDGAGAPEAVPVPPVCIPDRDWEEYLAEEEIGSLPYTEYSMLTPHFSDALLDYDRMILHAVAIRRGDEAWLICADSGVGKSTQARFLQELRPGEFSIICGDRPVLQFRRAVGDGASPEDAPARSGAEIEILVHPSPWNGKENWHGADAAPLAGLILLQRGKEDRLAALSETEAGLAVFSHVIQTWEASGIPKIAFLVTQLLNAVPAWLLTSNRVPDSTRLLLESVF